MAEKVKTICDNCGKEIYKYKSKISTHNFCNRNCYLQYHSKEVPICICEICGKEFKGDKYNANRFCSRACYDEFHNIKNKERICPTCGKSFTAKASEDKYCSWECYNKDRHMPTGEDHWNWQGGITQTRYPRSRSTPAYNAWVKAVHERDNYKCVICGSTEKLNAHHIKSWKEYPELRYNIDNGITYCQACHIKWHQEYGYDNTRKKKIETFIDDAL